MMFLLPTRMSLGNVTNKYVSNAYKNGLELNILMKDSPEDIIISFPHFHHIYGLCSLMHRITDTKEMTRK